MKKTICSRAIILMALILSALPITSVVHSQVPPIPTPREETLILVTEYEAFQYERFNPFVPQGIPDYFMWMQALSPPMWWINYATGEKRLFLISGWEYADEYKTFILHLRKGITWNDGVPYTSKDIAFTVNMVKSYPTLAYSAWANEWIEEVETPDDYTVVFHLKKPNPRFEHSFRGNGFGNSIVPEHIWKDVDPTTFANNPPVTTGPYKLYKIIPESKMFVLVRREDFWEPYVLGPEWFPKPKYLVYRAPGSADIEFRNWIGGWFDAAESPAARITVDMIREGLTYEGTLATTVVDFGQRGANINCAKYPLNISEFRWALSYCVDRAKLAKLWPMGLRASWPSKYPWADLPGFSKWEFPEIFEKYSFTYDLAKAAEILDKLGFIDRNGDGWRETPNGTTIELLIYAWEAGGVHAYMAEDWVTNLQKVGIKATYKIVPSSILYEDEALGRADITVRWVAQGFTWTGDPYDLISSYHSRYVKPIGERAIAAWQRLSDPELDEVIDKLSLISTDTPEGMELAKKAIELFMRDLPAIPFIECTWNMLFSTAYWKGWPTEANYYIYPAFWNEDFREVLYKVEPAKPPAVTYTTVWFLKDVNVFLGSDYKVYGPFNKGMSASIPFPDARKLVDAGLASFSPPSPEISAIASEIAGIKETLRQLASSSEVEELSKTVAALNIAINGVYTALYASIAINVIVLILAIAILVRKGR